MVVAIQCHWMSRLLRSDSFWVTPEGGAGGGKPSGGTYLRRPAMPPLPAAGDESATAPTSSPVPAARPDPEHQQRRHNGARLRMRLKAQQPRSRRNWSPPMPGRTSGVERRAARLPLEDVILHCMLWAAFSRGSEKSMRIGANPSEV